MNHNDGNSRFESQSETIVNRLVKIRDINREQAIKMWFGSKTYKEILLRNLTYISAMRAYMELEMENNNDPEWFQNEF